MSKNLTSEKHPCLGRILFCVVVGLIIYFFMPAFNGLTPLGVKYLSVFIPVVISWLVIGGTPWASLIGVTLMAMLGVWDGNELYSMQWGTALVAMVIPFFMLAYVLEQSGAIEWFVKWLISRKIVHGRPKIFMIIFAASLILVNAFVHPFVAVVLYFKILKQIAQDIGEGEDSGFYTSGGILIGWISQFADGTLIWMRPWLVSMCAVIAGYGFDGFNISVFIKVSFIYILFLTAVVLCIIFFLIKPDLSKLKNFDDAAMRAELTAHPMNKTAKIAFGAMGVVLVANIIATLSFFGPVSTYFAALPYAAPVTLVVAILAIIYVEGGPIVKIGEAAKHVPWESVIFLGTIMVFASTFNAEQFGIAEMLKNSLAPLVQGIPFTASLFLGLFGTCLFTNVASNSVAVIVGGACFIPALLSMPGVDEARILAFGACIILAAGTAIATRSACGVMALTYTDIHLIWNKKILFYAVLTCIIGMLFCIFVLVPFGSTVLAGAI